VTTLESGDRLVTALLATVWHTLVTKSFLVQRWSSKERKLYRLLMVRTFLKVYMELVSNFLFLQEQIKDIIIIISGRTVFTPCYVAGSTPINQYMHTEKGSLHCGAERL
jgi:hypothetical protein